MGEEDPIPAEARDIADAYEPTPEELAQMEAEAREMEAMYAEEAEAERLAGLALHDPSIEGWWDYLNWSMNYNGFSGLERELAAHGGDPRDARTITDLAGVP
jgi:hypothetical protein